MSSQESQSKRYYDEAIIDVLAYFVASRNYGYVDIISNALDPLTIREALINALRDFLATCIQSDQKIDVKKQVKCPDIPEDALEEAINWVEYRLRDFTPESMVYARSLALKALARASKFKLPESGEESSSS